MEGREQCVNILKTNYQVVFLAVKFNFCYLVSRKPFLQP